MATLYPQNGPFRNNATAAERLSDHLRFRSLPWTARRLARRHGLRAATARTVAELIGYTLEAR
jgi:hypothetical protein